MLTEDGHSARFWGSFAALRHVLGAKRIPDHYYGPTSVSDNMFEAVSRHLQLATLLREYEADVVQSAVRNADFGRALVSDLQGVRTILLGVSGQFAKEGERVERLLRSIDDAAGGSEGADHSRRGA